jgi:transposase
MLTITDKHRIFLAVNPIDYRTRLEGSLAICRQQLQQDPLCGHVFVFRNKKMTNIRCIIYDNGGFWFMEKRLSKGRYHYWPDTSYDSCELTATQLTQLLNNQPALVATG